MTRYRPPPSKRKGILVYCFWSVKAWQGRKREDRRIFLSCSDDKLDLVPLRRRAGDFRLCQNVPLHKHKSNLTMIAITSSGLWGCRIARIRLHVEPASELAADHYLAKHIDYVEGSMKGDYKSAPIGRPSPTSMLITRTDSIIRLPKPAHITYLYMTVCAH